MTQELSQTALVWLMSFSFVTGFAFGGFYDVFRIRRLAFPGKKRKKLLTRFVQGFIIGLEDLFFFLMLGCVCSVLFYVFSYGKVRPLALVTLFLGFLLYRVSIGRLVMSVADKIIKLIRLAFNLFVKKIIMPVVRTFKKIFSAFSGALNKAGRSMRRRRYSEKRKKQLVKLSRRGMID